MSVHITYNRFAYLLTSWPTRVSWSRDRSWGWDRGGRTRSVSDHVGPTASLALGLKFLTLLSCFHYWPPNSTCLDLSQDVLYNKLRPNSITPTLRQSIVRWESPRQRPISYLDRGLYSLWVAVVAS